MEMVDFVYPQCEVLPLSELLWKLVFRPSYSQLEFIGMTKTWYEGVSLQNSLCAWVSPLLWFSMAIVTTLTCLQV